MYECIMQFKKIRDKNVTLMDNNLEIYGACRHKSTFRQFFLSTDDTALWEKGVSHKTDFQTLGFKNVKGCFGTGNFILVPQG